MISIKNISENDILLFSILLHADDEYEIPVISIPLWANDDDVLLNISLGTIQVYKNSEAIVGINKQINILKGMLPQLVESVNQPFGSKVLPDGSKLFRRVRGTSASVQGTPDTIDFTIPFAKCKITGLQIIGGKLGDKATFQVVDTDAGTISGVPNYVLNTFGEDVYIVPDVANYPSKYDADLISGLKLRVIYDAVDELLPRDVYINFDLHEVVTS